MKNSTYFKKPDLNRFKRFCFYLLITLQFLSATAIAQTTLLSENFDNTTNWHTNQWTVAPGWANPATSGTQWSVGSMSGYSRSGAQYVYAQFSSNAYIITPALTLTASVPYTFSYWYRSYNTNTGFTIKSYAGTAQTAAGMTGGTLLATISNPVNTTYTQAIYTFTPSTSGTYYFGINVTGNGNPTYIEVDDLLITYVSTAPAITSLGTASGCAGSSITINGTNLSGATSVTIGGTPVSSITSNTATQITAVVGSGTSGVISVINSNGTASSTGSFTITPPPAQPASIAGSTAVCANSANTYSVTAVSGATSYTWTLPGTWSGTSTSNSINAIADANGGIVSVTANNGCGSSAAQTATISITPLPATPSLINGVDSMCSNTSSIYYVTAISSATAYTWTLPSGWTGTSTTDSITANSNSGGGAVTVTANNTCGSSTARSLTVHIGIAPAMPSSIVGITQLCDSSATAYAVTNDATATSYTWTLPSGWTGTSTTNSITATAAATNGAITVTANNGCGASSASTLNVAGDAIPVVSVTSFGTVCDNLSAFALTGGSPAGGTYSGTGVNTNMFDPTIAGDGIYFITYTYANGACVRMDSAAIVVDNCTGINAYAANNNISVLPNPAGSIVTISVSNAGNSELIISLMDIQGRAVYNSTDKNIGTTTYTKQVNVEQLAKGIYYIKCINGVNSTYQKLVIE